MKTITVKYGVDIVTKQVEAGMTIADLKENEGIQAALGFGDNINCLINGVAQCDDVNIPDGATVKIETAANRKA